MAKDKKIPKGKTKEASYFWKNQIDAAKAYLDDYHTRGDSIEKRYRDEDRAQDQRSLGNSSFLSTYNILYSNTETLHPILFSETPEVDVRATDTTSQVAREAAKMLEDVLNPSAKCPETIAAIEMAVKDLLLPGMGVIRVCYKPTITEREQREVNEEGEVEETTTEKLSFEEMEYRYIHWKDLLFPRCKSWDSLPWIGFRGLLTYDEAEEEFGAKIAAELDYAYKDKAQNTTAEPIDNKFGRTEIWEIWDKANKKVVWIGKGKSINAPLKIDDDPLELDEFFPIPKPIFSATTTGEIKPVPLFMFYQDLANELDEVSTRIRRNVDNLKRRGVYDSSLKDLERLGTAGDNVFLPIKEYAKMQGGLDGVMASENLVNQIAVLESLYKQRQEIIQAIYQVMGYADILRGQSDPRETLGAQRIKGRFGTLRISKFQREVQRLIRDCFRIAGQIIVNKFEPRTIALQTSVPIKNVEAYKLILQQAEPSSVMIDIQTDSTIAADEMADKQDILEFMRAISEFVASTPAMVNALGLKATGDLLLVLLKKFKMGRDIEQSVIDRVNEVAQKAKAAEGQPKQPSIDDQKINLEKMKLQVDTNLKIEELKLKDRELTLKEAELGLHDQREKQKLDFKGVEIALESVNNAKKFEQEQKKLAAEAANSKDNAVVGV